MDSRPPGSDLPKTESDAGNSSVDLDKGASSNTASWCPPRSPRKSNYRLELTGTISPSASTDPPSQAELFVDLATLSEKLYATTPATSFDASLDSRDQQHSPTREGQRFVLAPSSSASALSPGPRRRVFEDDSDASVRYLSVAGSRVLLWGLANHQLLPESVHLASTDSLSRFAPAPIEVNLGNAHVPIAVACSPYIAAVVTLEGKLLTWGRARYNDACLLGDASASDRSLPSVIDIPVRVQSVALGSYHALALTESGLYVWGSNSNGQLGFGLPDLFPHTETPALLPAFRDKPLLQVAAGASHSLALTRDGRLFAFGLGQHGQLGLGSASSCSTPNELKCFKSSVSWVSAALNHSACIAGSEAFVWGHGLFGRLLLVPQPVQVNRGEVSLCQVACGHAHIAFLSDLGTVYTFGEGFIGHENSEREIEPRVVALLQDYSVAHVSCGGRHTIVTTDDRRVYTFGRDVFGQLGSGRGDTWRPTLVDQLDGLVVNACASENGTAVVTVPPAPRVTLLYRFFSDEQGYLRTIAVIQKIYAPGLSRLIERDEDLRLLFNQLESVRKFTIDFLRLLHQRISLGWHERLKIADLFVSILFPGGASARSPLTVGTIAASPLENVYSEYCRAYRKCIPLLERLKTPANETILQELRRQVQRTTLIKPKCAADEMKIGEGAPDVFALIEPTRRVHHYLGFLQRVLEVTPKESADYSGLVTTTDQLSELTRKLSCEQSDGDFGLLSSLKVFRKLEVFLGGGHRYLAHISGKLRASDSLTPDARLLLLFDNKLAIATPEKIESSYGLEHLWVLPGEPEPNSTWPVLVLLVPEKPRVVVAIDSALLRDSFVSKIESAVRSLLAPHYDCAYYSIPRRRIGKWSFKFRDGHKYIGDWEFAKPHGKGVMLYANGDKYEGEFVSGLREGLGVLNRRNGERYEGNWRADKRQGSGSLHYAKPLNPNVLSADRYTGEFVDDRPHGHGQLCYDTSPACTLRGDFDKGVPHGLVVVMYQAGDVYVGEWQTHRAHGYGAMLYKNDDVYFGTWQTGRPAGFGYYACSDGTEYYGEWAAGRMQGKGTIWFTNRCSLSGKFNGHLVDNTLTMEGALQRDADPARGVSRKRLVRWENWFQLKSKLIRLPVGTSISVSSSVLESVGGSSSQESAVSSSPSSLHSSTSSLSARGCGQQLLALASLGATDAAASAIQLLRNSPLLSSALTEWSALINGLYRCDTDRNARLYLRVLEDVQSFLVALGSQVLRQSPQMNDAAGIDATWLALELTALPEVYDTVFDVIRKKTEIDDSNVVRTVTRVALLPLKDQLTALGLDRTLISWLEQFNTADSAAAVFAAASAALSHLPIARCPSEKLEALRSCAKEIEAAVRSQRSEIGADDFLPLFTWLVARLVQSGNVLGTKSSVVLAAEVHFIDSFMNENARTSLLGYLFINLMSACTLLRDLGPKLPAPSARPLM